MNSIEKTRTTILLLMASFTVSVAACGKKTTGGSPVAADDDPAKEEYERCLQMEKEGDFSKAVYYCGSAARLNPGTKGGKAAGAKSAELQVKLDASAKADAEKRAAAASAAAAEIEALKQKVRCPRIVDSDGRDDNEICVNKGLPRTKRTCRGGTYDENEKVASSFGCQHQNYVSSDPSMRDPGFNDFCCSK
jgi:hypothetical protein